MPRQQFSTGVIGQTEILNNTDQIKADVADVKVDVASVNTNVDTVKAGQGANTDSAGTNTLFAWFKRVWDWLTGSLYFEVDEVEERIGTSSDSAGTGTLFARAKQIYDYLAGTVIARIGASSDAAGTTTLFARLVDLKDRATMLKVEKIATSGGTLRASSTSEVAKTGLSNAGNGVVFKKFVSTVGGNILVRVQAKTNVAQSVYVNILRDGVLLDSKNGNFGANIYGQLDCYPTVKPGDMVEVWAKPANSGNNVSIKDLEIWWSEQVGPVFFDL